MEKTKAKQTIQITITPQLLQRIVFDWMLMLGVYLSYVIFSIVDKSPHIGQRSLSGVGWRTGNLGVLAFYVIFTAGFFIYQMRLFTKLSRHKQRTINWVMFIGIFLMAAGSCFPVSGKRKYIIDILHSTLCQVGTFIMALSIGLMVLAYCRETKLAAGSKAKVYVPYFVMLGLGTAGLLMTGSPGILVSAMFSLMATFMAMVYLHYLTVAFELAPKKERPVDKSASPASINKGKH